jgi:hypothetical protein
MGFAAGSTNLSEYVGNDSPNAIDPSGLTPLDSGPWVYYRSLSCSDFLPHQRSPEDIANGFWRALSFDKVTVYPTSSNSLPKRFDHYGFSTLSATRQFAADVARFWAGPTVGAPYSADAFVAAGSWVSHAISDPQQFIKDRGNRGAPSGCGFVSIATYKNPPHANAVFVKADSWTTLDAQHMSAEVGDLLLMHEQTHFDIAELYAKSLDQELGGLRAIGIGNSPQSADAAASNALGVVFVKVVTTYQNWLSREQILYDSPLKQIMTHKAKPKKGGQMVSRNGSKTRRRGL